MGNKQILNKPLYNDDKIKDDLRDYFKFDDDCYDYSFQKKVDFDELSIKECDNVKLILSALTDFNYTYLLNKKESKAVATFVAAAVGDALGIHTEFRTLSYNTPQQINNIQDIFIAQKSKKKCEVGEISSDTSIALCLADSIFHNNTFNPIDLRIRLFLYWHCGYNNCRRGQKSFGLGNSIKHSLEDLYNLITHEHKIPDKCKSRKDKSENNGNGSLMRLAPLPIAFSNANDEYLDFMMQTCLDIAKKQSLTTHDGRESYECCMVLAYLIIKNINYSQYLDKKELDNKDLSSKVILDKHLDYDSIRKYTGELEYSVRQLVLSRTEEEDIVKKLIEEGKYLKEFNESSMDRDWDWKKENFRYSPKRSGHSYVGSYCMDALSMALHIVYYSTSTKEAIFKAVNMGGDSNTVACIVGQIAGSIWGLDRDILDLYGYVRKYDNSKCAIIAYLLFKKENIKF